MTGIQSPIMLSHFLCHHILCVIIIFCVRLNLKQKKNKNKGYFCYIDTDRTACTQTTKCCSGTLYSQVDWKVTENPESTMLRSVRNRTHTCSLGVTLGAGIVLLPQNFSMMGPFSSGPENPAIERASSLP